MRALPTSTRRRLEPRCICLSAGRRPQAMVIAKAVSAPSISIPSGSRCTWTIRTRYRGRRSTIGRTVVQLEVAGFAGKQPHLAGLFSVRLTILPSNKFCTRAGLAFRRLAYPALRPDLNRSVLAPLRLTLLLWLDRGTNHHELVQYVEPEWRAER